MSDEERAKDVMETIHDRWGQICVNSKYAEQLIIKHLKESRGEKFEITAPAE